MISTTRRLRSLASPVICALWAVEESGLPCCIRPLDFAQGELKGRDYTLVNPFGHIPAIDDEEFTLFESAAIVLYVTEKAGKLMPADAKGRALAAQWAFTAVDTVEPAMSELFSIDTFSPDAAWAKARRPAVAEAVERRLVTLDGQLAERP